VLAHTAISGRHCELRRLPDGWVVSDLGSKNGVQVNRRISTGAGSSIPLRPGDELIIGRALRYRVPGGESKPVAGWSLLRMLTLAALLAILLAVAIWLVMAWAG
jgi:pSer/pThr/pTyr-binding forkhead associated (FHA) protein